MKTNVRKSSFVSLVVIIALSFSATVADAQVRSQPSTEIPQEFKQALYETYENHDFTWGGKDVALDIISITVYHISKPIPIPEKLRYKNWIDDRTYGSVDPADAVPGNYLHPGAKMRSKQVTFGLDPGAAVGFVTIVLETDGWLRQSKNRTGVKMQVAVSRDILCSGDYKAFIQEVSPYLVPAGSSSATQSGQAPPPSLTTPPGLTPAASPINPPTTNPLIQQANDLDKQAEEAAAKAQELEQKAKSSGPLGAIGGIKNSLQAKQLRNKERQYRQQAQDLRAKAQQLGTTSIETSTAAQQPGTTSTITSVAAAPQPISSILSNTLMLDLRLLRANDLDKRADEVAAKAQELEREVAKDPRKRVYAAQAQQERFAEQRNRKQAQDLRATVQRTGVMWPPTTVTTANVLGCVVTAVTAEIANHYNIPQAGVLVLNVDHGSWCEGANLGIGSVITKEQWMQENAWVTSPEQFYNLVSKWPPDQTVSLLVARTRDVENR